MVDLTSLPQEILEKVFSYSPPRDLNAACKALKFLQPAAKRFLYREIELRWEETRCTLPVHLLLRTLIYRPSLALHVHTLTLRAEQSWRNRWWSGNLHTGNLHTTPDVFEVMEDKTSLTDDKLKSMKAVIVFIAVPSRVNLWQRKLDLGDGAAFVDLLIALLSGLRCLKLDTEFHQFIQRTWEIRRQDGGPPGSRPFSRLKRLALNCELSRNHRSVDPRILHEAVGHDCFELPSLLSLFTSPAMESVSFSGPPWRLSWPDPMQATRITSLVLVRTHLSMRDLCRTLRHTSVLERLDYQMTFECGINNGIKHRADFVLLGASLSYVRRSLEFLTLSIEYIKTSQHFVLDATPSRANWHGRLTALHGFEKLREANIPVAMLLGSNSNLDEFALADVLPRSLKALRLTDELLLAVMSDKLRSGLLDWIRAGILASDTSGPRDKTWLLSFAETTLDRLDVQGDWRKRGEKGDFWGLQQT